MNHQDAIRRIEELEKAVAEAISEWNHGDGGYSMKKILEEVYYK